MERKQGTVSDNSFFFSLNQNKKQNSKRDDHLRLGNLSIFIYSHGNQEEKVFVTASHQSWRKSKSLIKSIPYLLQQ